MKLSKLKQSRSGKALSFNDNKLIFTNVIVLAT